MILDDLIPPGAFGPTVSAAEARRIFAEFDAMDAAPALSDQDLAERIDRDVLGQARWQEFPPGTAPYLVEAIERLAGRRERKAESDG